METNDEKMLREAEFEINLEDAHEDKKDCNQEKNQYDHNVKVPTLEEAITDCNQILGMFFNNQFIEAVTLCEKFDQISVYHSLGKSFLLFIFGMINLEPPEMKAARDQIRITQIFVQMKRKSSSLLETVSSYIWRPNYDEYTDEEAHAELMFAELQIIQTLLTIFGDQNILSMVKGAFRMRAANNSYKICGEILGVKRNWNSNIARENFESGYLMGSGIFNLILSHLPSRVLKLLTLVGFTGSYNTAIGNLKTVTDHLGDTVRYRVTQIVIIIYSLYLETLFGVGGHEHESWAEAQVNEMITSFPNGAIPLLFLARLKQTKGFPDRAIEYFLKCTQVKQVQVDFKTLQNVCYWEISWSYAKQCDWMNGAKYAMILKNECNWSPATNMYQYACFLYMEMERLQKLDQTTDNEIQEMRKQINHAMSQVPVLKIRYAGKTIPPEKFAITKANRYISGSTDLCLPALELFYVWNLFSHSSQNNSFLTPLMSLVEEKLQQCLSDEDEETKSLDRLCFLLLMKGVILRYQKSPLEAVECFLKIIKLSDRIFKDHYLPPHAAVELGVSYAKAGKFEEAKDWLEKARRDYSGFLIESMIHVRVHGALMSIKRAEKKLSCDDQDNDLEQDGDEDNEVFTKNNNENKKSSSRSRKGSTSSNSGNRRKSSISKLANSLGNMRRSSSSSDTKL